MPFSGKLGEKGEKSRIPEITRSDSPRSASSPRQHPGAQPAKLSGKGEGKFGFKRSPSKIKIDHTDETQSKSPSRLAMGTPDQAPNTKGRSVKSPQSKIGSVSGLNLHQPSRKTCAKDGSSSSGTEENLVQTSTKTDHPLDQTFSKSQLTGLVDETSNQPAKTDQPLNETYVKSQSLSELIDEVSNQTFEKSQRSSVSTTDETVDQSSSQIGSSGKEPVKEQSGLHSITPGESHACSSRSFSKPLETVFEAENTTEELSGVEKVQKTANAAEEIMQRLQNISVDLQRNLSKANQMRENLTQKMESGDGVTPQDVLHVKDLSEAVDAQDSEMSAIADEVQMGSKDDLYPVPWSGVRTVGFLLSLIGSDNVVSLSPREAATTINKDVLKSHYQKYVDKAQSKKEMVETIKKITMDSLRVVEGQVENIRRFVDSWKPLEKDSASVEDYQERRKLLLECRMYLRQTADDFNLLMSRMDQYVMERAGLLHVLSKFLRKQIDLFPEYKNLSPQDPEPE